MGEPRHAPVPQGPLWHDVECGAYAEDLPIWERLAAERDGPILDLGAGTGRVALHLARRGHEVRAVDVDPELVAALRARAEGEGLMVEAEVADLRCLPPGRLHSLVIAPMQLIQLMGGREGRVAALRSVSEALEPGGTAALAIVEGSEEAVGEAGPGTLPDVRETDGWVHSSLPLGVASEDGRLRVRRLRQVVSPAGRLTESQHIDVLDVLDAPQLEREAAEHGLRADRTVPIAPSELHVGSVVVVLERTG
ncbi:MAG: class I SAM-dependent methyltransferase [Solirubrobacterales bacterium]